MHLTFPVRLRFCVAVVLATRPTIGPFRHLHVPSLRILHQRPISAPNCNILHSCRTPCHLKIGETPS
jgi:hypothetical protein